MSPIPSIANGTGGAWVGVLQRFEHRLQEMYDGGFARAFKSDLQPTEVAGAVQREMDDRAAIVAQGRTLVPNDFVAEIAQADYDRLQVYADNLGLELATLARDYAEIRVEDGDVVLVDLGSTNGTFVEGQPIRRVSLTDGTRVTLGRTTLVFRRDGT